MEDWRWKVDDWMGDLARSGGGGRQEVSVW